MHLAKDLEFKAPVVLARNDDMLPPKKRIDTVSSETELKDVYGTKQGTCSTSTNPARGTAY